MGTGVGLLSQAVRELVNSPLLLVVGVLAVFVGIVAMVGSFALGPGRQQLAVARSLAAVRAMQATPKDVRQKELERPIGERVLQPLMGGVTALGRRLTPAAQLARIRRRLDLAGNPGAWDVDRVVSLKVLLTVIGTSVSLVACLVLESGFLRGVAVVAVTGGIGWLAPSMIIYQLAYNRSERIQRSLPDALDLLTISVESGLGFDAAVAQVARNSDGPLAEEFFRVLQEMQIGTGRMDALRGLGERSDVPDLMTFVSAMVQADSFGVPIAAVLRIQADEMRTKRSQRAEEAAQRIPVKILFPLIFGILPALFVVVIGPGVIQAFGAFSRL